MSRFSSSRSRRSALLAAFIVSACTRQPEEGPASSSGDAQSLAAVGVWPMYGHDLSNTQSNPDETTLGIENVDQLEAKWHIEFSGGATSQPVVYDGTLYFGGWDGRMYAADALSGALVWLTPVTPAYVRSTPFVTEDRVYAAGGQSVLALDRADGRVIFETELDSFPLVVIDGSPKRIDDLVIVGVASGENTAVKSNYRFEGRIFALDADDGEIVWEVATTGDGGGYCSGGGGVGVWSTPAFDPALGLMYVGTGQNYEFPAGNCEDSLLAIHYARSHAGERVAWHQQYNANDVFIVPLPIGLDGDIGASPVLFEGNGRPLVGAGDKAGTYRVFDRCTGDPIWRANLTVGDNTQLGGVMTTAAVGDGALYVASNVVELDGTASSVLHRFDAPSGAESWRVALPAASFGAITLANGVVYHAISDGTLYAREAATGREIEQIALGDANGSAPTIVNGRLYVSTGMVVTPDLEASPLGKLWSFGLPDASGAAPAIIPTPPLEPPPPATTAECAASLAKNEPPPSAACSSCLCDCDATAWAHCPWCYSLAPCTAVFCGLSAEGEALATCLDDFCSAKLIPPGQFSQNLDAAPCVQRCSATCAF